MLLPPLATLPGAVMFVLNIMVSVRRLERYFGEEELEEVVPPTPTTSAFRFDAETIFCWPNGSAALSTSNDEDKPLLPADRFSLRFPALALPESGLVLVTGKSASGKTAFLTALLGELDMMQGQLHRPNLPSLAYGELPVG